MRTEAEIQAHADRIAAHGDDTDEARAEARKLAEEWKPYTGPSWAGRDETGIDL